MHRIADRRLAAFAAAVTDMRAARPGEEFTSVERRVPLRAGSDPPQRSRQQVPAANARVGAVRKSGWSCATAAA